MWINISLIRYHNFVHKLTTHRGRPLAMSVYQKNEAKETSFRGQKIDQKRSWMATSTSQNVFCKVFSWKQAPFSHFYTFFNSIYSCHSQPALSLNFPDWVSYVTSVILSCNLGLALHFVEQGAEELFVMTNKAKILRTNGRVASVYCRIYFELNLSNSHETVLLTW